VPADTARLVRPVGRRDLRVVAILLCVCALAVLVGAARAQGGSPPAAGRGCVRADVAGLLGGGTVRGCGRHADAVCRAYAGISAGLAAQCAGRRRGDGGDGNP
jgi:hypothetical protein